MFLAYEIVRLPGENGLPTAASVAFVQDAVSGTDRNRYTALPVDSKAALAGSPVHTVETDARVLLETKADSKVAGGSVM